MNTILNLSLILWGFISMMRSTDLPEIRRLYQRAPLSKEDGLTFFRLMQPVGSTAIPLINCYKGAAEMIQAKYALNPMVKAEKV